MKVDELKNFLRLRGLKVSGRKEELVATAFIAIENNVQIVQTAEEVDAVIGKQYLSKLNVALFDNDMGTEEIPDPFKLIDGWISEEEGVKLWPPTLYPDIFNFFAFHPSELASNDLSDYKTSKGIEAAVRMGLSNPSCTSTTCEWLPNNKQVKPVKIKDLKLARGNFGRRGKRPRDLNSSPKKKYDPAMHVDKSLTLTDVCIALKSVCKANESIIFAAEVKEKPSSEAETSSDIGISTFEKVLLDASIPQEFIAKIDYFAQHITDIEEAARGQSGNYFWFAL
eukprot:Seg5310.5 transcript_id=Seg5310.5/GoldUCD/mRNA.D3Y31 product="hypothetical protein" protein_id=Seg5310.5/GoldUCD/D3Y31